MAQLIYLSISFAITSGADPLLGADWEWIRSQGQILALDLLSDWFREVT